MLEFGNCFRLSNAEIHLSAFRDLLVVRLRVKLGVKLLFGMDNHIKFSGMIRGGQECYADAMLPKCS